MQKPQNNGWHLMEAFTVMSGSEILVLSFTIMEVFKCQNVSSHATVNIVTKKNFVNT